MMFPSSTFSVLALLESHATDRSLSEERFLSGSSILLMPRFPFRCVWMFVWVAMIAAYSPLMAGDQTAPDELSVKTGVAPEKAKDWLDQKYLLGDFCGKRSHLEDQGVTIQPAYTGEVFGNPLGGKGQGTIYEGLLELQLNLDFEKLADFHGGSFQALTYYPMGASLSKGYTGDLLGVSNIDAYDTPHLFELWYQQTLWDDKISMRVGQLGVDSEFFISTYAASFLGGTYGWPGLMAADAPTPAYAYATQGYRLRIDPSPEWTFQGAVFNGNPAPDRLSDPNPNRTPGHAYDNTGLDVDTSGRYGVFSIGEVWYKLNQEKDATGLPGTYKLGAWLHTDTFSDQRYDNTGLSLADPASSGQARALDGNNGFYIVADQAIWQDKSSADDPQEVGLFFRAGNAEGDRCIFDYYLDGGVVFKGFIPARPNDLFGIATGYGHIGNSLRGLTEDQNRFNGTNLPIPDGENNIELTYQANIAPWIVVQPDMQIIIHPGGSSAISDALVLGCRTVVSF